MTRREQRCKEVQKVLNDYKIEYKKFYNNEGFLKIKNTPFYIEVSNRYIDIAYKDGKYFNYLKPFEEIIEFRDFVSKNGTNFMMLKGE